MYKVILADADIKEMDAVECLLNSFPDYNVIDKISDPKSIMAAVVEQKPNLIMLSIVMGKQKGLDIAKEIISLNLATQIIFITAYARYAIDAYECGVCDYLLKPVTLVRLSRALQHFEEHYKAINPTCKHHNKPLRFNTQKGFDLIKPEEIVCMEADQVYTTIRTTDNKRHHISQNIGKLEKLLCNKQFIRISR